ncbi:Androglobin [Fasciolopsis buskii]|uniref:Androglobin n=1 Tax=Fasciolopsis buskii TaxID=27845 RepID=A0A8E0RZI2_9TREM|nr:Androglobin [Fasciolopsis buski]
MDYSHSFFFLYHLCRLTIPNNLIRPKSQLPPLWPEWTEQDVNNEKWPPVVFDPELIGEVDLFYLNEHLFQSEDYSQFNEYGLFYSQSDQTMRWIMCEIQNLWLTSRRRATVTDYYEGQAQEDGFIYAWKPWEHVYAMTKVGKEPNVSQYNPYGKYLVKLFWMGCWRKIVVDDLIPFGEDNLVLLPRSRHTHELWPMLLTKGLLKIAALDYGGGLYEAEFGDFSPIHALTGWTKHTIVLRNQSHEMLWDYLERYLPTWERPSEEASVKLKNEETEFKGHEITGKLLHKESKGNVKEKVKEKKSPPAPFKAVPRWKLIRPLPSDFPHIEEESESLGIVQEPEPIRSLGLWTPLQDLVFRDSTYLVPDQSSPPVTPISGDKIAIGLTKPGGKITPHTLAGGGRSGPSNAINQKNQRRGSQEEGRKKGPGTKSKDSKSSTRTGESVTRRSLTSTEDEMVLISQRLKDESGQPIVSTQRTQIMAAQPKEYWIDVAEFCELFNVIDVYHKPQTYPVNKIYADLKVSQVQLICTQPSEILFNFSAICRWPPPMMKEPNMQSTRCLSGTLTSIAYSTVTEAVGPVIPPSPAPATLIVESHHWLDNRLGVPLKRLDVTGSRTVSLLLPPGRHSYRLLVHAPMGYVLQVLGTVVEVPDVAELSSVQQHTEAVVTNTGAGPALTDEKPHITSSEKPMQSMPKTGTTQRTTSARFRPCTSGQTKQTGNSVWSILNVQLGDEDTLLTEALSLTPVRMRLHAQRLIRALGQLGLAYSDLTQPDKWMTQSVAGSIWQKTPEQPTVDSDPDLLNELELYSRAQCYLEMFGQKQAELATLLGVSERIPLEEHAKLTDFRKVLLGALQKLCADDGSATADMNFAWRVTQFDMSTPNPLGVQYKSRKFYTGFQVL